MIKTKPVGMIILLLMGTIIIWWRIQLPDDDIYVEELAMNKRIFNTLNRRNSLFTLLASAFMIFLLAGYAAAANIYGTLDRDRDLDNMFLNYEVLQDYNYYTSGGYDAPNAILLINKDYKLDNPGNLWVTIPSVDNNQMRKWVSSIGGQQVLRSANYYAAYILDQNGQRVGVWYSVEMFASVKFPGEGKIFVQTPALNRNYSILSGID
jgi:hypothetical protein